MLTAYYRKWQMSRRRRRRDNVLPRLTFWQQHLTSILSWTAGVDFNSSWSAWHRKVAGKSNRCGRQRRIDDLKYLGKFFIEIYIRFDKWFLHCQGALKALFLNNLCILFVCCLSCRFNLKFCYAWHFFYTCTACGACDKYEVCLGWEIERNGGM